MSAMEAIMRQGEQRKQEAAEAAAASTAVISSATSKDSKGGESEDSLRNVRKDYWLFPGLVVKVIDKKVGGGRFYKCKGKVEKVLEKYVAVLHMLDGSGARIQIDQDDLETVIPKTGGSVRIVNGRGRGLFGTIQDIDVDAFVVSVRIEVSSPAENCSGQLIERIEYEDVCKCTETD